MKNYSFLETCTYLGCRPAELVALLREKKLECRVENERIIVPEGNIEAYVSRKTESRSVIAAVPQPLERAVSEAHILPQEIKSNEVYGKEAEETVCAVVMSEYASHDEIRTIEDLGYAFQLFEAIVTTFTTRTRGLKGGFSFDHICKRVKNYKTRDKRRMLARLVEDGVVSFDGRKSYSLTGQVNTAKHLPLRNYLRNYLQSKGS